MVRLASPENWGPYGPQWHSFPLSRFVWSLGNGLLVLSQQTQKRHRLTRTRATIPGMRCLPAAAAAWDTSGVSPHGQIVYFSSNFVAVAIVIHEYLEFSRRIDLIDKPRDKGMTSVFEEMVH